MLANNFTHVNSKFNLIVPLVQDHDDWLVQQQCCLLNYGNIFYFAMVESICLFLT